MLAVLFSVACFISILLANPANAADNNFGHIHTGSIADRTWEFRVKALRDRYHPENIKRRGINWTGQIIPPGGPIDMMRIWNRVLPDFSRTRLFRTR